MPPKMIQGFDHINKATMKVPVGHTRTGACQSRGRCTCPKRPRLKAFGGTKRKGSKI